jgi:hypothetical protein
MSADCLPASTPLGFSVRDAQLELVVGKRSSQTVFSSLPV